MKGAVLSKGAFGDGDMFLARYFFRRIYNNSPIAYSTVGKIS